MDVAISSYHRAEACRDKTLRLLSARRVPADNITVFVADAAELARYEATLVPGSFGRLVVGAPGFPDAPNAAIRHYVPGTPVVFMDDDVTDVVRATSAKTTEPVADLGALFKEGFSLARSLGSVSLWGVYPIANPYFMKPKATTDLKLIVGPLYGMVVTHQPHGFVDVPCKEDYQRSMRFYAAEGAVLRLNWYAPVTRYCGGTGGLADIRTAEMSERAVEMLTNEFPGWVRRNPKRKGDHVEILLSATRARKTATR